MAIETTDPDPDLPSAHRLGRATRSLSRDINSTELTGVSRSFARNAAIYREGDPTDDLYKIVNGIVRACKALLDGRRQVAAFYLPGDMFGLEPGATHLFSSEAVIETDLVVIKRSTVLSFQLRDLMLHELQLAQNQLLLLVKTAPERVASFLLEMSDRFQSSEEVELPMTRRDIADYLGLRVETVSRIVTKLERHSVIALPTYYRVVLRNRAALEILREGFLPRSPSHERQGGSGESRSERGVAQSL